MIDKEQKEKDESKVYDPDEPIYGPNFAPIITFKPPGLVDCPIHGQTTGLWVQGEGWEENESKAWKEGPVCLRCYAELMRQLIGAKQKNLKIMHFSPSTNNERGDEDIKSTFWERLFRWRKKEQKEKRDQ